MSLGRALRQVLCRSLSGQTSLLSASGGVNACSHAAAGSSTTAAQAGRVALQPLLCLRAFAGLQPVCAPTVASRSAVQWARAFSQGSRPLWAEQKGGAGTPAALPPDTLINPLQMIPRDAIKQPKRKDKKKGDKPLEARAVLKGARISPTKLNPFARLVRRIHVHDALIQCAISQKKAAKICEGVIRSAYANAKRLKLDLDRLHVEEAFVGKGHYEKRTRIHGRGRAGVMHRKTAHLTVVLRESDTPRRTRVIRPYLERLGMRTDAANAPAAPSTA